MEKMKCTAYPYAKFNAEGQFDHFGLANYKVAEGYDPNYGIYVNLPPVEVEFEVPDTKEVALVAAKAIEAHVIKLQGEHQLRLMKAQAAVNCLRGLEYQEVLDRAEPRADLKYVNKDALDVDDDLPF